MNLNDVIEKLMNLHGLTTQKDLAVLLGISPQDFSNRKRIGTLLPVIFEWAIHGNVNLNWLFGQDNNHAIVAQDPAEEYRTQKLDSMTREMITIMSELDNETKEDLVRQARKEKKRIETERKLQQIIENDSVFTEQPRNSKLIKETLKKGSSADL